MNEGGRLTAWVAVGEFVDDDATVDASEADARKRKWRVSFSCLVSGGWD